MFGRAGFLIQTRKLLSFCQDEKMSRRRRCIRRWRHRASVHKTVATPRVSA